MNLERVLGITYIVGMIGYIGLNMISKKSNKHYYNLKNEFRKFKSIRDEINDNQGWFKK